MSKRSLPTPETLAIGLRLAKARNKKDLTLEDVAHQMNVTPSLIGQYEKGKAGLTAKRIHQLMNILEVDMSYILTGNEPEEEVKAHTKVEKDILKMIRNVDPQQQELLLKNIQNLIDTFEILIKK